MKLTVYELLGMVKDKSVDYDYVKYFDRLNEKDDIMLACAGNIIYKLENSNIELNDVVQILGESKGIPEKIKIDEKSITVKGTTFFREKDIEIFQKLSMEINEIIDYLESKGE